jgi:hypothetical protein
MKGIRTMNERTPTPGQGGSTLGKASTSDRYSRFTDEELDAALMWLSSQGSAPWSKRFKIEGDNIVGDLRGMPPAIRQLVREQFEVLELMTPTQVRQLLAADLEGRVRLVDHVMTEAGR